MNVTFDRAHSAVPISFACSWAGTEPEAVYGGRSVPQAPPAKSDKIVAAMFSNCQRGGAYDRFQYVAELMRYISVHSYGRCLHNRELPPQMQFPIYSNHGESMRNKIVMFSDYRFVLAFENSNTTDYVSEKVYNALQSGALPVYMGSSTIEDFIPVRSHA